MSRQHYQVPTQKLSARSANPTPLESTNQNPRQLPIVLGAMLIATGFLATLVVHEFTTPSVISILGQDISLSAQAFPKLGKQHCKDRTAALKTGDVQIDIHFADIPELVRDATINNSLERSQCQPSGHSTAQQPTSGVGKHPGTSLESFLTFAQTIIATKRTEGLKVPVVMTISLQEAEPTTGQSTLNLKQIQKQIEEIAKDKSVVAIIGPTGQLQIHLTHALKDNPNARICPFKDATHCVNWAFKKGRKMGS